MRFNQLHPLVSEPNETSRALRFPLGAGTSSGLHPRGAKARGGTSLALLDCLCPSGVCGGGARACSLAPPLPGTAATRPGRPFVAVRGDPLPGAPAQRQRQAAPRRQQQQQEEEEEEEGRRRPPSRRAEAQAEGAFAMRGPRRRRAAPSAAHPPAALPLTGVRRDLRGGRSGAPLPGPRGKRELPGCERPLGPALPLARSPSFPSLLLLSALSTSPAPE